MSRPCLYFCIIQIWWQQFSLIPNRWKRKIAKMIFTALNAVCFVWSADFGVSSCIQICICFYHWSNMQLTSHFWFPCRLRMLTSIRCTALKCFIFISHNFLSYYTARVYIFCNVFIKLSQYPNGTEDCFSVTITNCMELS